jgi:hypothetical protein
MVSCGSGMAVQGNELYRTNGADGQNPQDERRGKGNRESARWGYCTTEQAKTINGERN